MQKIYFVPAFVIIAVNAKAQFTKGQKLIGPSFQLNVSDSYSEALPSPATSVPLQSTSNSFYSALG